MNLYMLWGSLLPFDATNCPIRRFIPPHRVDSALRFPAFCGQAV